MSWATKSSSRVFMPMRPVPPRALLAVGGDGGALEVGGVGDGDGDLLVCDEVFEAGARRLRRG